MNKILLELDLDKWQKVQKYGHCLCNIKRKCPCSGFPDKCFCGTFQIVQNKQKLIAPTMWKEGGGFYIFN